MEMEEAAILAADLDEVDTQGLRDRMLEARQRAGTLLVKYQSPTKPVHGNIPFRRHTTSDDPAEDSV